MGDMPLRPPHVTERQTSVLNAIRHAHHTQGFPPTMRELAATFSCSPATILKDLQALQAAGLIVRGPGARAITIVEGTP